MSLRRLKIVPRVLFLDFDGVFTDNYVNVNSSGSEILRFSKYDSYGISRLKDAGIILHVISSDSNGSIIKQRCDKMRISFSYDVSDKVAEAIHVVEMHSHTLRSCAFIGNDLNDLGLLDAVGMPIVVNDAHHSLLRRGYARTRNRGGHGAIREVADRIIWLKSLFV